MTDTLDTIYETDNYRVDVNKEQDTYQVVNKTYGITEHEEPVLPSCRIVADKLEHALSEHVKSVENQEKSNNVEVIRGGKDE